MFCVTNINMLGHQKWRSQLHMHCLQIPKNNIHSGDLSLIGVVALGQGIQITVLMSHLMYVCKDQQYQITMMSHTLLK